jgi:hypothetical protein
LEEHAQWEEGELVSVPILVVRLSAVAGPSPLQDRLMEILSSYSTDRGNSLPLSSFDKPLDELGPLAATKTESDLLEQSRHYELFYKYRNFIVHEFREPGYAMETFADGGEEPLYHSYIGSHPQWRLLYPEGFFRARALGALNSLERFLRDNDINPFARVKDSGDWLA